MCLDGIMKSILCLSLVLLAAVIVESQLMTPVVLTDKGPLRGRLYNTAWHSKQYSSFMGIPYAKPPVKELRFRDPVEPDPWTEVFNATNSLYMCPQTTNIGVLGSEDCLYLNVYTPLTKFDDISPLELKPVVFWIYGGGFATGFTLPAIYGPDFFLEEDIVMVAVNYRIDILGFLTLDVPGIEGNAGLKDQQLGLKWVQKNIAKFGGDPNRVTIMGESAGGASVGYHLILPKSQGLFHKAILQSGTPLAPWAYRTREDTIKRAFSVANLLGHKALNQLELLDFLQSVDVEKLIETTTTESTNQLPLPISFQFVPTKASGFLDNCPIERFQSGNFTHVPVLLGYNHDEALLFATAAEYAQVLLHDTLVRLNNLDPKHRNTILIELANNLSNASLWNMINVGSAFYFSSPVDLTQRYLAKHNREHPIYFYRLSIDSKWNLHNIYNARVNGTAHADDIGYLFNVQVIYPTDPNHPYNEYRRKLVALWANFIKHTNPTPLDLPINGAVWLPSGTSGAQLEINTVNEMKPRLLDSKFQLLEAAYEMMLPFKSNCDVPSLLGASVF